ncbi:MAG: peptide chain release factor N(5)-glutamine methyltransferase [Ignavibacteriales bacterium]|nr:peptide chain release factor N(5)-glutamine methyltransferase [Ignavibacteriales bacterium]
MTAGTPSEEKQRIWTILELIEWGKSYLTEKGIDEARLTMELLLAHTLHCARIELYTRFDQPLRPEELASFKVLLQRRLRHEPLQYITGTAGFMGLNFTVSPAVLIPRPETEIVVEKAVEYLRALVGPRHVLDVGTGSGCIAISCARLVPDVEAVGLDVSTDALAVAAGNAMGNGVHDRVRFVEGDIRTITAAECGGLFQTIVSNPPYIGNGEYAQLPSDVREYEPRTALADGGDGLAYYRILAARGCELLDNHGTLFVEHSFDQSNAVVEIFRTAGWRDIMPFKDYSGNWRGVEAHR